MHFEGTFEANSPKEWVYAFVMDPKQISQCMPDLQKLEVNSPEDFVAVVKAGVSFIKGDFTMHFTVPEKNPPNHARLLGHGTGIGSSVDLDSVIDLSERSGGGTIMKWSAEAKVGGRIASVGSRLINRQAEKIIKQLFECLESKLESLAPAAR